jgi:hypothetical protein
VDVKDKLLFIELTPDDLRQSWNRLYVKERFRHGYYTTVTLHNFEEFSSAKQWCADRFGPPGEAELWMWRTDSEIFYFVRDDHAMEFKLRWV